MATSELKIEPRLKSIMEQEYPRFSDAEYARAGTGCLRT